MVSIFLPEDTKQNVLFGDENSLFEIINKNQVEKKYGGTAPNCVKPEDFYPYRFPGKPTPPRLKRAVFAGGRKHS